MERPTILFPCGLIVAYQTMNDLLGGLRQVRQGTGGLSFLPPPQVIHADNRDGVQPGLPDEIVGDGAFTVNKLRAQFHREIGKLGIGKGAATDTVTGFQDEDLLPGVMKGSGSC